VADDSWHSEQRILATKGDSVHGGADSQQRSVVVPPRPISMGRKNGDLGRTAPPIDSRLGCVESVIDERDGPENVEDSSQPGSRDFLSDVRPDAV